MEDTRWPQPTLAGLAILAVWIAGILLAASGISVVARRLKLGEAQRLSVAQTGWAD